MSGWLRAGQLEARHNDVDCLAVIKAMKKDSDEKLERQSFCADLVQAVSAVKSLCAWRQAHSGLHIDVCVKLRRYHRLVEEQIRLSLA